MIVAWMGKTMWLPVFFYVTAKVFSVYFRLFNCQTCVLWCRGGLLVSHLHDFLVCSSPESQVLLLMLASANTFNKSNWTIYLLDHGFRHSLAFRGVLVDRLHQMDQVDPVMWIQHIKYHTEKLSLWFEHKIWSSLWVHYHSQADRTLHHLPCLQEDHQVPVWNNSIIILPFVVFHYLKALYHL